MKLTSTLTLPIEAVGQTIAVIAQKGMGKTYAAMKLTELMLAEKAQVVGLDPTGVWWGLRSGKDGEKKGGFEILILGGAHGDAPLASTAGAMIADFVVSSGQSVILDLSAFNSNAEQDRFVTDFAERLFRAKHDSRTPLHLMLDEADSFAPQKPMPGQQRMLGAFEAIVRRGRSRGLGMTMITQRPAVLNKNVLSQADMLVCLRVVGAHDHKALVDWTALHATAEQNKQFFAALPSLPRGRAFFWSPGWLRIFEEGQILEKKTFDSSKTPEPGANAAAPKLAAVDIDKLSKQILATAEEAKANDPRQLRQRISELEKQLQQKEKPAPEKVEVPVLKPDERLMLEGLAAIDFAGLRQQLSDGEAVLRVIRRHLEGPPPPVEKFCGILAPAKPTPHVTFSDHKRGEKKEHPNGTAPTGGIRRMMIALAQRSGLSAKQLGVRAGLSSTSGTFGTYLGRLRSEGWMEGSRDSMSLTAAGVSALGDFEPLPTGEALLNYWLNELGGGARRMLESLAQAFPKAMTRHELGQAADISALSGTFGTYLGKLRTLELVETVEGGQLRASSELFS